MNLYLRICFCSMFCAAILIIAGCAGTSKEIKTQSQTGEKSKNVAEMDESFNPLDLGDYHLNVKKKAPEDEADLDYTFLVAAEDDTSLLPKEAPGYRVQIFASTDQEEANAVRRDAILRFDEDVYIVFDNPYYKVRVGDCLSRYQADALQIKAENKGYLDAWVIRTKVKVKKSLIKQP